jgi:hypothetical protein
VRAGDCIRGGYVLTRTRPRADECELRSHVKPKWMQRSVCYRCSYDLRGLPAGTCPECGTELSRGAYKRFLAQRSMSNTALVGTMVATGLGTFLCGLLGALFPRPEVPCLVVASTLSLVAAMASCWFFIRVLARDGASWFSAFGVIPGLVTWAVMMYASYGLVAALALLGISVP